jgi:hypothetical protein
MPRTGLHWFSFFLPGIASLVMGCGGYTSEYVPPPDGRPRLVWQDNKVVPTMSNAMPSTCSAEVDAVAGGDSSRVRVVRGGGGGGGVYWVPVRTVAVVHVGGPVVAPLPRPILPGPLSGGGIGRLGGGGGGGGDLGKAAVVVAVLAIAVLPFIALGLATGRPEPEKEVADAIDRVNAQTDLARVPGSPCDELVVAGGTEQ